MGSKNKQSTKKSGGKRKSAKVSTTKLSNKRLNKLAKQGKLKKLLPHGKYVQLLKNRLQGRPGKNDAPREGVTDALMLLRKSGRENDIPLEEADYEYYSKPNRDYSFLTEIEEQKKRRGKRKRGNEEKEEDDEQEEIEAEYAERKQAIHPEKRMRALLPIKGKEGIVQREEEIEEEEISENEEETELVGKPVKMTKAAQPVLTPLQALKVRQEKLTAKKQKIALLCSGIIENPEENTAKLRQLRGMLFEKDPHMILTLRKLVMVSLMEVFKDILPGYHIRVASDKEKEQSAKKETKKLREYEESLLNHYKHYLEFVDSVVKPKKKQQVNGSTLPTEARKRIVYIGIQCLCELLVTHPHFNYRTNILSLIIPFVSGNLEVSDLVIGYVKRIFREDKSGEVTLEIVRIIGRIIKARNYCVKPKVLDTFLSLRIKDVDFNQERDQSEDKKNKSKVMSRKKKKVPTATLR